MSADGLKWCCRWGAIALAGVLVCGLAVAASGQQRFPRGQKIRETSSLFEGNPPQHVGEYSAFNLIWQPDERVRDVLAVFPDPLDTRRIVLATGGGLLISDDTGRNWKEIPGTAPAAIGTVRHVEFSFDDGNSMYLASAGKGVWRITDPAKTPQQIGSKAVGLISDSVSQVRVDGGDPLLKTLLAVHGSQGAGISRSQDGGRTWKIVPGSEEYFIDKLLCAGPGEAWAFAMAGKDATGPRGVYFCLSVGDFFKDYAANVPVTDGALEILFDRPFSEVSDLSFWSTTTAGLLKTEHAGTNTERIGPADVDKWASIGVTYGATADARIIYAYEPRKMGLAVSHDDGQTFASFSEGLPSGGFVKEGAQVRANAGGNVFFAAINNMLYVGRRNTGEISISDVEVTPPTISYAPTRYGEALNDFRNQLANFRSQRDAAAGAPATIEQYHAMKESASGLAFTITARIAPAENADKSGRPASVTVDLSRVGGSTITPMYDDGLHGDGAANDGVYGATCLLRPDLWRNHYQDRRRPSPGPMALTITAVAQDGSLSSAIGVLCLMERVESHVYWLPSVRNDWKDAEGGVGIAVDDYQSAGDKKSVKLTPQGKPWSVPLVNYYNHSILGYQALSFYVKTDGALGGGAGRELYVQLKDSSPDTVSAMTVRVPVVKEKLVEGGAIDQKYHRVVVPFSLLLKDPPEGSPRFRPTMLYSVIISGDAVAGRNYWIGPVRFHAAGEDLKVDEGGRP